MFLEPGQRVGHLVVHRATVLRMRVADSDDTFDIALGGPLEHRLQSANGTVDEQAFRLWRFRHVLLRGGSMRVARRKVITVKL